MLYGMSQAEKTIMTHPNHEHLLKVLQKSRNEMFGGQFPSRRPDTGQSGSTGSDTNETESWPSERQDTYPSSPNTSNESFDEDTLYTDEEISRQNQGGERLFKVVLTN